MIQILRYGLLLVFSLAWGIAGATHLKAGQITAERSPSNPLQYIFTLTVYTDVHSIGIEPSLDLKFAVIDFNDGVIDTIARQDLFQIDDDTYENVFVFSHTFPASGNYYVSFEEQNRNENILNIPNSGSVKFYIQSLISISPFTGINNTPVLLVPPIDEAAVGEIYIHNPGAFDPDGDSLSFKLTIPKQDRNVDVAGYTYMTGLSLDPYTGDLVWDRPLQEGLYNVAFLVEEWRNGRRIGYVLRDMQIEVVESDNDPPVLTIPADICIEAGTVFHDTVFATDPDGHAVTLTSYGGAYSISDSIFFTLLNTGKPDSAAGEFLWKTNCSLVRNEPYQIIFKAEDNPPSDVKLTDLKTLNIKVVAPAPVVESVTGNGNSISIEWEDYLCAGNAKIEIYRRDCDSGNYTITPCGEDPSPPGFTKVGETNAGQGVYTDTKDIHPGSYYCYILLASFPAPGNGKSFPSPQICVTPGDHLPIPVLADVEVTDTLNGALRLSWTQAKPDSSVFPPPYSYVIYRAEGIDGTGFTAIDTLSGLSDTIYTDTGLNTGGMAWSYQVRLMYGGGNITDHAETVSSVFATITSWSLSAHLTFDYNVPWSAEEDNRRIYRKKSSESAYSLLTEIPAGSYSYTDTGLVKYDTVCYYAEVAGKYCRPDLPELILNRSQEVCIIPVDSTPPCPPVLYIDAVNCDLPDRIFNKPFWKPVLTPPCNDDIRSYRLFFAQREDEPAEFLTASPDTFFVHTDPESLAGCYEVTAISSLGMESERSNRVCVDICTGFALPNLITPNGDGKNDLLEPIPTPRNVKSVEFSLFNRWGSRTFFSDSDVMIRWNGTNMRGEPVPDGTYYYEAKVTFKRRLKKMDEQIVLKGWLQVIRGFKDPG